jgi:hypothetical protein
VELRIISPKGGMGLERFIEEYRNLYKISFDNALVPPGLRITAQHAFFLSEKPKLQLGLNLFSYLLDRGLQLNINKNIMVNKSGDFEFQYIHLWDLDIIQKEKNDKSKNPSANFNVYTISEFAHDIVHAVSVSIPGLRRGKSLLLKSNTTLSVGRFWSGRPNVHLLNFQGQALTARQNDTKFQNEFGWIIGGAYEKNNKLGKHFFTEKCSGV